MNRHNNPAVIEDIPRNRAELELHLMIHPYHDHPSIRFTLDRLQHEDICWGDGETCAAERRCFFYRTYKNGRLTEWE